MRIATIFSDKKKSTVAIAYFLIHAFLLFRFGVQQGGEAEKFIDNANRIINGQSFFNAVFGYFYIVYILLLASAIKLSVNFIAVALLQVCLSFYAALCLYKLLVKILANDHIAFLFFILYLLCYPIQKWNLFLYSESIHTSLLVIAVYNFNSWMSDKKIGSLLNSIILLVLVLFSRPVGILFLASVFVVLITWLYRQKKMVLFYMLTSISVAAVILVLNSPYTAFVNPDSIRRMEIICQVPEVNAPVEYKEYNREGLYNAFTVIKNEVGYGTFFTNGFKKLGCFFGMYRSYYSWPNNLLLICFTVFYPFALVGAFSRSGNSLFYVRLLSITYLLLTSIGIFFTCDEWSNRFISPAFPFVLILAAIGAQRVFKRTGSRIPLG